MSLTEIEARARDAGLPPPVIVGDRFVIVGEFRHDPPDARGPDPRRHVMTPDDFKTWAESAGGWQAAADYLNGRLGTRYTRADVWRWGSGDKSSRPVPTKIARLLGE